jgi:hypothetical protein
VDINNITKEEKSYLVHAVGWAIDKLSKDIEQSRDRDKDKFQKSIEFYKRMHGDIKNLKTVD